MTSFDEQPIDLFTTQVFDVIKCSKSSLCVMSWDGA